MLGKVVGDFGYDNLVKGTARHLFGNGETAKGYVSAAREPPFCCRDRRHGTVDG